MDRDLYEALDKIKEAALEAFQRGVRSIILKGSALKGDFIPGYSDLDVHVYVSSGFMQSERVPKLEPAIRFQRRIGGLDPERYGVSSFQVYFIDADQYPEDWQRPLPGSYRVIYGDPVEEASPEESLERARDHLVEYPAYVANLIQRFVDKPDKELPYMVRLAGATLKGAVHSAVTVATQDPEMVVGLSVDDALDVLKEHGLEVSSAASLFSAVRSWHAVSSDPEGCRRAFRNAIEAMVSICCWYEGLER